MKRNNRKNQLKFIIIILVILFVVGSFFICDVIPDNRRLGAYFLIAVFGVIECFFCIYIATCPSFQNLSDFDISEEVYDNKKIINIRYKDYEFEFINQFDIKLLNNVEKNKKRVSIYNKYKIKRFYKYALLNILNRPMDLKNIEQYESVRRATNDEILEYRELLEKTSLKKCSILRKIFIILFAICIFISILGCWAVKDLEFIIITVFNIVIWGSIVLITIRTPKYYLDKEIKKARKILKILNESEIFVIEVKKFLYKFVYFRSKHRGYIEKLNRLCIFKDENGYYINEWFWDAEVYESMGSGREEFPYYPKNTEKIYIIKNNNEIIADRKIIF